MYVKRREQAAAFVQHPEVYSLAGEANSEYVVVLSLPYKSD